MFHGSLASGLSYLRTPCSPSFRVLHPNKGTFSVFVSNFSHQKFEGSVAAINKAMTDNNVKATYDRVHVSIQEDAKSYNAIYVYPNPTNNNVNIHLDDASSSFTVTIHDLTGKVVYTSDYSNTQDVTISTSDLNSGYYSLSIISSEGISTRKIMVN